MGVYLATLQHLQCMSLEGKLKRLPMGLPPKLAPFVLYRQWTQVFFRFCVKLNLFMSITDIFTM